MVAFIFQLFIQPCFAFQIYLDAGHGGSDRGAVQKEVVESKLVLLFTKELEKQFREKTNYGISLSRDQDSAVSLQKRVDGAHAIGADLYLSLHANSTPDARAKGIEIFFRVPQKMEGKNEAVRLLADLKQLGQMSNSLVLSQNLIHSVTNNENELQKTSIAVKQAPFYVLTKTRIPALLIEIGFLTHPREKQKLMDENYRSEIAQEIVSAVRHFVQTRLEQKDFSDKSSGDSLN